MYNWQTREKLESASHLDEVIMCEKKKKKETEISAV